MQIRPLQKWGRRSKADRLLYKEEDDLALRYVRDHELLAIEQLGNDMDVATEKCGSIVDRVNPYLAGGPDGLIGERTLVDVKCPFSARLLTPIEAVQKQVIKFSQENKDGYPSLKRLHNYNYQGQGQLNITGRTFRIFVV